MVAKPAKNPSATRNLVTEIDQRIKLVEDTTGKTVDEDHAKIVLIGILDPTTRQHTAMEHGTGTTFQKLKKLVL